MEISTIFALFVGTIVIIHFLDLIASRFSALRKKKELRNKRADWYCFFSPSVLFEKNTAEKPVVQRAQENVIRDNRLRREQEQRRPVLKI